MDSITFKRDELYKLAWEKPISRLSKEFMISDVGLAKICRKLNVPLPPRGYWAKKAYGKVMRQAALPKIGEKEPHEHVHHYNQGYGGTPRIDPKTLGIVAINRKIVVLDSLEKPHRLIRDARRLLKTMDPDGYGMLSVRREPCLDVRVSPANLNRALRILDALVKGCEAEGYQVTTQTEPENESCVEILGEKISFGLFENSKQIEHVLTEDEKRQKAKWQYWSGRPYDYIPTGELTLKIKEYRACGRRKNWVDSDKSKVEEHIGDFIASAVLIAHVIKKEREIWREKEKVKEEEQRKVAEEERRVREETERLAELERQADQWAKSQKLREFIRAVEFRLIEKITDGERKAKLQEWVLWAKQHADRLDPICQYYENRLQ